MSSIGFAFWLHENLIRFVGLKRSASLMFMAGTLTAESDFVSGYHFISNLYFKTKKKKKQKFTVERRIKEQK